MYSPRINWLIASRTPDLPPLQTTFFQSFLFSSPWLDLQLNCYISWSTCDWTPFSTLKASVFESSSSSSF
ncbi:hypothetical protein ACN42_g5209 [Penicillium freii]|uniref:Uncharacterized protein n=1 Tax=Penicillium freii TaxID=48697 RepID=A0A101MJT2_PENFR|nr:hypothetical protein ACN42_g5209 [Penicillium freii]